MPWRISACSDDAARGASLSSLVSRTMSESYTEAERRNRVLKSAELMGANGLVTAELSESGSYKDWRSKPQSPNAIRSSAFGCDESGRQLRPLESSYHHPKR